MSFKKALKKNELVVDLYDKTRDFYSKYMISDEKYIRKQYRNVFGEEVDLENPTKFNEKLQWLKLNWYDPIATKCADKYDVRDHVSEKIGPKYLNELISVYESVEEIDIDKLPQKFVLKGTHGSGFNIICEDKNQMNWAKEFKKMRKWLKKNYYWQTREWVYKDIKPRIICERYLENSNGEPPIDYKFLCFNGEPRLSFVCLERFQGLKVDFYDLEWNKMDFERHYPKSSYKIPKPKLYEEMIEISRELSKGFPFVRVDLYEVDEKLYFGELTFFPGNGMEGFTPKEYDEIIGNHLELPQN